MGRLSDWHIRAAAEFQDYFGTQIVSTYGRLLMEYAAIFRSTAMMDMAGRGVVQVGGEERYAFLDRLLTAELISRRGGQAMNAGDVKGAFLLDRKGRVQADVTVIDAGEQLVLEMELRLVESVRKELEKYRFREKVTISQDSDVGVLGAFGPAAGKLLDEAMGTGAAGLESGRAITVGKRIIWREDLGDAIAYGVVVPLEEVLSLWEDLTRPQRQTVPIGWAAYNTARVEAARAAFGIDYDNTFLPAETGELERRVSFTKGCYPGQEIVARMQSRGQCAKSVVSLRIADGALPMSGEKVFAEDALTEVGAITSSSISPRRSGAALALATVKKPAFDAGTKLLVPAEGKMRDAVVA